MAAAARTHRSIANLKAWLHGTHRDVSREHLQVYLDEFAFRHNRRRTPMSAQLGRSPSWVQGQIGHADMTTMQRYYMQASRSEIQPRIKRSVEYLLGESSAPDGDGAAEAATDRALERLLEGDQ